MRASCFAQQMLGHGALLASLLSCRGAQAEEQSPVKKGEWQVVEVRIDTSTERKVAYGADDARLRYRIVNIQAGEIVVGTPENLVCKQPTWRGRDIAIGKLWKTSFDSSTVPKNWGFAFPTSTVVRVFELACANDKAFGAPLELENGELHGTWFFPMSDGRLALRWYDQTVLILRLIPENERPRPSFDCTKASADSERAICATHTLAGLDRGISELYKVAREYAKDSTHADVNLKRANADQRAWLSQRNACGADASCIMDRMKKRSEQLGSEDYLLGLQE